MEGSLALARMGREDRLDQAVEARRKAVASYRAGQAATLDDWTDFGQALGTESKARQKYHNALEDPEGRVATQGGLKMAP